MHRVLVVFGIYSLGAIPWLHASTVRKPFSADLLFLCYPSDLNMDESCKNLKDQLTRNCRDVNFTLLLGDIPFPTLEDIRTGFGKRTRAGHLNAFIKGHGHMNGEDGLNVGVQNDPPNRKNKNIPFSGDHLISTKLLGKDAKVSTRSLRNEIASFQPDAACILATCHGGGACRPEENVIAPCAPDQVSYLSEKNDEGTGIDALEVEMAELLCKKDSFDSADKNQDGKIDEAEMKTHLCEKFLKEDRALKYYYGPSTKERDAAITKLERMWGKERVKPVELLAFSVEAPGDPDDKKLIFAENAGEAKTQWLAGRKGKPAPAKFELSHLKAYAPDKHIRVDLKGFPKTESRPGCFQTVVIGKNFELHSPFTRPNPIELQGFRKRGLDQIHTDE